MKYFCLALGLMALYLLRATMKGAEAQGMTKQELKQATESLKETKDAITKSDAIDKELAHYDDDAIDRVANDNGWLRQDGK